MNKKILAIYDSEESYAYGLTEYISCKEKLPFDVYVFTKKSRFSSFAASGAIHCLLIAEAVYESNVEEYHIPHIVILSETKNILDKALHHIHKYQSCETIFHEIMKYYSDEENTIEQSVRVSLHKLQIIGIYTPVGRCLQTTFSMTLGQMLAKEHKTLYLNFETYSGFSRMLHRTFDSDITDLMYYFSCAKEKLVHRINSMVESVNGLDFIPPATVYQNLDGIRGNQWLEFFSEIEKFSEYEYLILDLTDCVKDLWDVLRNCTKVFTITRQDGLAMAKVEQYEKALEELEYGDISAKTTKWKLPVFTHLPVDFNELTYGELARYIRQNVFPIITGEMKNEANRDQSAGYYT